MEHALLIMRILYDYQIFTFQRYGGISNCFYEIIRRISTSQQVVLGLKWCRCLQAHRLGLMGRGLDSVFHRLEGAGRHVQPCFVRAARYTFLALNIVAFLPLLIRQRFDLLHLTDNVSVWWLGLLRRPFVCTVHDMIPELFYKRTPKVCRYLRKRHKIVERATRVITVSENTKTDAVRIWGLSPDKVDVVHHGASVVPSERGRSRWAAFAPYILYVGGRDEYKDFIWFLHAVSPLLRERKNLQLLCTGNPFTLKEREKIARLGVSDRCWVHFFEDDELFSVYHEAKVFVYPSRYEGFGIPILDAFAAGCPVVLSRASCFPEVADDAAAYFELNHEEDLRRTVAQVLDDLPYRDELIRRGKERVQAFTWDNAAAQTVEVYRRALAAQDARRGGNR